MIDPVVIVPLAAVGATAFALLAIDCARYRLWWRAAALALAGAAWTATILCHGMNLAR